MHLRLRGRSKIFTVVFYKIKKCRKRSYSSCINVNDVCIISGVRTPIGSFRGKLATVNAVELASTALSTALDRSRVDKTAVQEFILGNVFSGGCGQSLSYQVAMSAGLPDSVISYTVNKLCGSGLKAIMIGSQLITTNSAELIAVGGVESTSNVPYILKRRQKPIGHMQLKDSLLSDGLIDPYDHVDVTAFAEETIKEYKYKREDMDSFALESYAKAAKAQQENVFSAEISPVLVKKKKNEEEVITEDEEIQRLNVEKFKNLKPEMGKDGTITPGNTSALADGAAMLILASGNYVLKKNLRPLARVISYADGSLNRKHFTIAPATAMRKALIRANLSADQIHLWEISETFPVTALLNAKLLDVDISKVNTNGGSISLGHPFGMTGARIVLHLAHIMTSGMMGCASISHATGGASAMIIEKF